MSFIRSSEYIIIVITRLTGHEAPALLKHHSCIINHSSALLALLALLKLLVLLAFY